METGCQRGIVFEHHSIRSPISRMAGSIGKHHSFWAMYSLRMSAWIGPGGMLSGTIQADILKEYIAQKEWCFPIDPAMRLLGDLMEWSTPNMPRWHPVSISGYHIREAGSTAAQELAFTLKDG